jgi:hypothetical protein
MSEMFRGFHVITPLFLSDFLIMNFLDSFLKNAQIPNFMRVRSVGAEFHAGGRAGMTKVIVALRNFSNAPKNLPDKICREVQNTFYIKYSPPPKKKNSCLFKIMWKNMVGPTGHRWQYGAWSLHVNT